MATNTIPATRPAHLHLKPLAFALAISAGFASPAVAVEKDADKETDEITAVESEDGITLLEGVTVSGEKTRRSLKNTTSSVSVVGEEKLSSTQNLTVREAINDIPNVVTLSGSVPDIRGVSGNGAAGGFNSISGGAKPRVSMLIDGVAEPFVADWTGDSGLWDVEQIEVYRGPQSTNNGRNSIGGAIYLQTKDPTFDWEGAARLGYRDQEEYVDKALAVSGPIVEDKLAFRISAQKLDGQTLTNTTGFDTNPPDYDLNELTSERVRSKLLWKPTEDFEALLTHSSNNEQGDTGRIYYSGDDPWAFNRIYFRDIETDSDTTSLKLDYQLNDSTSMDVLAATTDYKWGFDSYAATEAAEQQLVFDENNKSLDAKLNFGEGNEHLNGFVGLAYFERDQDFTSTGSATYNGDDSSDSKAVYGEINYGLTDKLTLTGGARVERESQNRDFTYSGINYKLQQSKTITLPKLALQYDLTDQTTLGVSARKGYNSPGGALNVNDDYYYYDEEKVNTYEFSVRSDLANGNVSVKGNLFYNDYDGYQALNSSRTIVNMDKVSTYGVEVEANAAVTPKLNLSGGVGLLKTKIDNGGENYASVTGNELNSAPAFTANVGAKYAVNDKLSVGGSYQYVDEYYGDIENTEERKAGGYGIAKLSADYEVSKNLKASAFVNNATNEKALLLKEPAGRSYPAGYASIVEPRNVGLSLTYSF